MYCVYSVAFRASIKQRPSDIPSRLNRCYSGATGKRPGSRRGGLRAGCSLRCGLLLLLARRDIPRMEKVLGVPVFGMRLVEAWALNGRAMMQDSLGA